MRKLRGKHTLTNSFHGTTTRVRSNKPTAKEAWQEIQVRAGQTLPTWDECHRIRYGDHDNQMAPYWRDLMTDLETLTEKEKIKIYKQNIKKYLRIWCTLCGFPGCHCGVVTEAQTQSKQEDIKP